MEKLNRILEFEKQFSSIDLSLKLKDLGASQETCFMWVLNKPDHPCAGWSIFANSLVSQKLSWEDKCSAYSCAELLELLPYKIKYDDDNIVLTSDFYHDKKRIMYIYDIEEGYTPVFEETDTSEANARAKLLITLIESKLMEIPNVD